MFQEQRVASCPRGKRVQGGVREVGRDQIACALGVMIRNFRFHSNQSGKSMKMVKTCLVFVLLKDRAGY